MKKRCELQLVWAVLLLAAFFGSIPGHAADAATEALLSGDAERSLKLFVERLDGIEVIDFKTDTIDADQASRRAERYRPQMKLYASAMEPIFKKPVTSCHLVFLHARSIVQVDPAL